ncbi:MAG: DUF3313 domain-containing protein [Proteobacteria bacterium]|nr:DUF3313 domain-containing protein [Pseudomonadota bacterium]
MIFVPARTVLAILGAALLASCATTGSQQAPASWDGLEKRDAKDVDALYVRPNYKFPHYRKVILDPCQVSFSKDWDPNSNTPDLSRRLDSDDIQKIKDGLAKLFRERFTRELTAGGYEVVDTATENTIRVTPAIIDLYVNAPDKMAPGISRTYTTSAGAMTLAMEVRDAPTGALLARVVDRQRAMDTGRLQWTNSVTNTAEAERAIDRWARQLRAGLDRVNGPNNP